MKNIFFIFLFIIGSNTAFSQSATTNNLHKKHEDAFYLFFYENTLRMLDQFEDENFSKLIDQVDKAKFLRLNKEKEKISKNDVALLFDGYKSEAFEEIMSMRHEGANVKVLIKEKDKISEGLVMVINDEEDLAILDIKGSVPLDQVMNLYNQIKTINQ